MTAPLIFYPLAVLILIASIMVVSARSAIVSALFLVLDLFLLACVYASLNAHFVAAIQLLVYAGAILVLFLFVIMLLNVDPDHSKRRLHLLKPLRCSSPLPSSVSSACTYCPNRSTASRQSRHKA